MEAVEERLMYVIAQSLHKEGSESLIDICHTDYSDESIRILCNLTVPPIIYVTDLVHRIEEAEAWIQP